MLCYIDDFIHIGFKPKEDMVIYWLKKGWGSPDWYLGVKVEKLQLEDGRVVWYTNCVVYLKITIGNTNSSLGVDETAHAQEMIPRHILEAIGKYVVIKAYVDANHKGNMENRISHYGIIIYVNNEPMIWYHKHQNLVEA